MAEDARRTEKLRKIEALFAGTDIAGERLVDAGEAPEVAQSLPGPAAR